MCVAFLVAVLLPGQKNMPCASFSAVGSFCAAPSLVFVPVPSVTHGAHFLSGLLVSRAVRSRMEVQKAVPPTECGRRYTDDLAIAIPPAPAAGQGEPFLSNRSISELEVPTFC